MQVFNALIEARGGKPLPLQYYVDHNTIIDDHRKQTPEDLSIDPSRLRIDRRTFFEVLDDDQNFPLVSAFLLGGVDVNWKRPSDGATALHIAALSGMSMEEGGGGEENHGPRCANNLLFAFLIDNGAQVDATMKGGRTPLMCAAQSQNIGAINLLLSKGADLFQKDSKQRTCLSYGCSSPQVMQVLRVWFGDRLRQCAEEECILHRCCLTSSSAFAVYYIQEELQVSPTMPLSMSVAAELRLEDQYTPLQCAVVSGRVTIVKACLSGLVSTENSEERSTAVGAALRLARSFISSQCGPGNGKGIFAMGVCFKDNRSRKEVEKVLQQFAAASTEQQREKITEQKENISLLDKNGIVDGVELILALTLPHLFLFLLCLWFKSTLIHLCGAAVVTYLFIGILGQDSERLNRRPLRSLGITVGFIIALYLTGNQQHQTLRSKVEDIKYKGPNFFYHAWFAVVVAALVGVVTISPGVVKSSRNQRKAIYLSLRNTPGSEMSKELLYSIDARLMVRKPMRAQYCHHLGHVVLRLDYYASHLASTIGAYNHRLFFFFHVFLLIWVNYVRFYATAVALLSVTEKGNHRDTGYYRFVNFYTSYLSLLAMMFAIWIILTQLLMLRRNMTHYDLTHAHTTSSLYCFSVGGTDYSLYDEGLTANLAQFFVFIPFRHQLTQLFPSLEDRLPEDRFTKISYRVPKMGEYLKKVVEEKQRWLDPQGGGSCSHDHGDGGHGHSHGGGAGRPPNLLTAFQNQPPLSANPKDELLAELEPEAAAEGVDTSSTLAVAPSSGPEVQEGGGAREEGEGGDDGGSEEANALAQAIFQEMIAVGGPQIYQEQHGTDKVQNQENDPRKKEWYSAVEKASQMYQFFTQSLHQQQQEFLQNYKKPS